MLVKHVDEDKGRDPHMKIYVFCDKCMNVFTTFDHGTFNRSPSLDKYKSPSSEDGIRHIKNKVDNIEKMTMFTIFGIWRANDITSEHMIAQDAGIIVGDKHICKSCWSETKLKTDDFKERIEVLRKGGNINE
jgi:hypothetical protein